MDADAWPGVSRFGNRVLPGSLAASAHDEQVSAAQAVTLAGATPLGAKQKSAWCTEGDDGDRYVSGVPTNLVTVPSDAVSSVTIETKASRTERSAALFPVVIDECQLGLLQRVGGQRIVLPVVG